MQLMRTYNEIYQSIVDKKNTTPELSWFVSASLTAIWMLLAHITATAIFAFEQIFYTQKAELESKLAREQYGFIDWYAIIAKKFQYGDSLVFDPVTGTYYYEVIDEAKQIITAAAAVENELTNQIKVKVAKGAAPLSELSALELTAFTAYMKKVKVGGTNLLSISQDSDTIAINGAVKYNPQYALADINANVMDALVSFKLNFNYNGLFRRNDIISAIREASGVVDFVPSVLTGQPAGGSSVDIPDQYETQSGYYNYSVADPENQFTYEAV